MHSRIIALNIKVDEDEVYAQMEGCADYVSELDRDNEWALEILEAIGTVDKDALTFRADKTRVQEKLEAAYRIYQEAAIKSFDDFTSQGKVWRAADALEDRFGVRIITDWSGCADPWLEFLRDLWHHPELMDKTWNITHVFDYHF
jgi:hypothetical protein